MAEKTLEALRTLGFIPEEIEDFGYRFEYEGLTLAYPVNKDDSNSITLMVPNVFDITDDNRAEVFTAMLRLCRKVKYVQPHIMHGDESSQVWLNYQHYLGEEGEPTPELIEHMVRVLDYSTVTFHRIINGDDNED